MSGGVAFAVSYVIVRSVQVFTDLVKTLYAFDNKLKLFKCIDFTHICVFILVPSLYQLGHQACCGSRCRWWADLLRPLV